MHILKGHLSTNSSFRVTNSSCKVCKSLLVVVPFVWLVCLLVGTQIINCRLAVLLLKFANLPHWHNEDNAFGDKKSIDFFSHKHLLSKQADKGHHSTDVFKPLLICPKLVFRSPGRRIHAFRKRRLKNSEFREFFLFLFPFIFPVRKVLSQCPNALLGGAEWQGQAGTGTHGELPCGPSDGVVPVKQCPCRLMSWTGEGYWMIPCPRWGWSGLCSQFCRAVLLAHIFLCIIFLRSSEQERVQLNLRAGHRAGASSAQPHCRKTPEQQRICLEVNVLSAAVGDSGAGWAFLGNRDVSSGFVSSQRTPAHVLGSSPPTEMMSLWETQDLRQEHGTTLAYTKQPWL